ncbi:MAG: hypothetical protein Q8K99_14420 [Actinomycetota bacterium]|nr:hypothetical protein [Actinomycetota bacterium]
MGVLIYLLALWLGTPLVCAGVLFFLRHQFGRRAGEGDPVSTSARVAARLAWWALAFGLASLLTDAVTTWLLRGTNSDMAGIFLFAGLPLLALSVVLLVATLALGRLRVSRGAAAATACVLLLGGAFTASIDRIWWFIYSG